MLILLLRIAFVVLATYTGHTTGAYLYRGLFEGAMPLWFGAAMGFGVSVTLIAAEQGFRRHFTRSLVALLGGLGAGLLLSIIAVLAMRVVIQDLELAATLDAPLTLVITYLLLITVLRNVDRWRIILPFVELRTERFDGGTLVADPAMVADARLPALLRSGFFAQRLLIHTSAVTFWEAPREEPTAQAKARRALEILGEIRALPVTEIDATELPNTHDATEAALRLARLENARLLTADESLARRAGAEGIPVVDLAALVRILTPPVVVGSVIRILLERIGEGRGQAVGHLADGSLVVVAEAAERVGQEVEATVIRLHPTANGRMVFANLN